MWQAGGGRGMARGGRGRMDVDRGAILWGGDVGGGYMCGGAWFGWFGLWGVDVRVLVWKDMYGVEEGGEVGVGR